MSYTGHSSGAGGLASLQRSSRCIPLPILSGQDYQCIDQHFCWESECCICALLLWLKVMPWHIYSGLKCSICTYRHAMIIFKKQNKKTKIWKRKKSMKFNNLLKIRGAFNKFPDFFLQAFKIVVDSWQFSMLLLYILWDDWPNFVLSRSNEQLQQQLEYTQLKPDWNSSQLVKFKNAILTWGHFRRTICNKILF